MFASVVGLSTSDAAYARQAATQIKLTIDGITVCANITRKTKELDTIEAEFTDKKIYHSFKSKFTSSTQTMPVCFIVKHLYFKNLHTSLDRIDRGIINRLIPNSLKPEQKEFPRTPYPKVEFLWLDKEYQLLALKKLMACDNSVPFLLTGPFGTGKTRVLATAAINFLKRPANRVLICTSHLHSADAYIDNYFGPMTTNNTLPLNVNPVRLVGKNYNYSGSYEGLIKRTCYDWQVAEIMQSRLIITTSLTAPQLKGKCFTHILIDEGAQTREPETIAPLGLADDNTKIVIAGDHLQVWYYHHHSWLYH